VSPPEPQQEKRQSGLSLQTLIISSLAAATAAIVVPTFWQRGSVIATAFTPIVVAIVSEALKKPADVITSATPRVARRSATGAAVRSEQPEGVGARGEGPEQVSKWGTEGDPFGLRQPPPRKWRFPWKVALITGLVAAVIGGGVVTASELALFGNQIGDSDRQTGLFGGTPRERSTSDDEEATPTPSPTEDAQESPTPTPSAEATPTPTPTVTPTPTPSVAPRTASPTPTVPPTEATPVPTGTP
jgi:hypothetical protein